MNFSLLSKYSIALKRIRDNELQAWMIQENLFMKIFLYEVAGIQIEKRILRAKYS